MVIENYKNSSNFIEKNSLLFFKSLHQRHSIFVERLTENSYEGKIFVPRILHKRKQARHYLKIEFLKAFPKEKYNNSSFCAIYVSVIMCLDTYSVYVFTIIMRKCTIYMSNAHRMII